MVTSPPPDHDLDVCEWAVVLGCAPGSSMLRSRCARALRLVRERQARRLFLTGTVAEVADMVAVCADAAVELSIDDQARRTLDNVRHAKDVVGNAGVWIVTSRFHLPRALFLARHVGLRARGAADDGPDAAFSARAREAVAWCGALVDVLRSSSCLR